MDERPSDAAGVNWARWFLVAGLTFGLVAVYFQAPGMSPDEAHHFARVAQIARGELTSPLDSRGVALAQLDPCTTTVVQRLSNQEAVVRWRPSDRLAHVVCQPPKPLQISNTAVNNPVAYVPNLVGYALGRLLGGGVLSLWLARLTGLLGYLLVGWLAIRIAPYGKGFLFFIALLPTPISLAVTVSADPSSISLALLSVALLLRLRVTSPDVDDRRSTIVLLTGFAVSLVALTWTKNIYAPFALLALLVPTGCFRSRPAARWYRAGVIAVAVGAFVAWTAGVTTRVRFITAVTRFDSRRNQQWAHAHPWGLVQVVANSLFRTPVLIDHTLPGMLAHFHGSAPIGNRVTPWWIAVLVVGLGALAWRLDSSRSRHDEPVASDGTRLTRWAPAVVVGSISVAVLVMATVGEFLLFTLFAAERTRVAYIEGRFFVPLLPLLLLLRNGRPTQHGPARRAWRVVGLPLGLALFATWYVVTAHRLYA